jgi:hypothetical protein
MKLSHVLNPILFVGLLGAPGLVQCGGDRAAGEAQCEDWSRQASTGRRVAQDEAGRDCSTDGDCEIVDYGLRCFADCGYPSAVASSMVPALEATIEALDERNCDRFENASCPGPTIPPCDPPDGVPSAVCRNRQCTLEFALQLTSR